MPNFVTPRGLLEGLLGDGPPTCTSFLPKISGGHTFGHDWGNLSESKRRKWNFWNVHIQVNLKSNKNSR